jgi:hypothetical protein
VQLGVVGEKRKAFRLSILMKAAIKSVACAMTGAIGPNKTRHQRGLLLGRTCPGFKPAASMGFEGLPSIQ